LTALARLSTTARSALARRSAEARIPFARLSTTARSALARRCAEARIPFARLSTTARSALASLAFAALTSACAAHYDLSLGDLDAGAHARDAGACEGGACIDATPRCSAPSPPDSGDVCCREDDDCPRDTPTCDRDSHSCVQCFSDADCEEQPGKPRCVDHRCRPAA
jgi:hypothetical protein